MNRTHEDKETKKNINLGLRVIDYIVRIGALNIALKKKLFTFPTTVVFVCVMIINIIKYTK